MQTEANRDQAFISAFFTIQMLSS